MQTLETLAAALAVGLTFACTARDVVKPADGAPTPATVVAPTPVVAPAPTPTAVDESDMSTPNEVAREPDLPAPAGPVGDCGLRATLSADQEPRGTTKYTLTLKNEGTAARTLVVPGDGSGDGRRTPMLAWSATRDGKPAQQLPREHCGMMNPIEASEIFTLEPGASRAMSAWISGPSYARGRYEVRLRYTNDPRKQGAASPEIAALLAKTSACDVTSAPLTIQVP